MKKPLLCSLTLLLSIISFSQESIDVTDQTIKIGGNKSEEIYLSFASGDKIVFNFREVNNKEIKEIEILEYPNNSKFSDFKTSRVENKTITVSRKSVYTFRFKNSALGGRVCKINVQRIPANEETRNFNTSVSFRTVYDTVRRNIQERYLVSRQFKPVTVIEPSKFYVNSGSNATFKGGKSRITVPIFLPKNTVEWYYIFSAYRDETEANKTKNSFKLLGQLSTLIDPSKSLNIGIGMISAPPGGNICDIYLLDGVNRQLFEEKTPYKYLLEGSRQNIASGAVKIKNSSLQNSYIGIKNSDNYYGIHLTIEAVAIVLEEEWGVREVEKYDISSREEIFSQN